MKLQAVPRGFIAAAFSAVWRSGTALEVQSKITPTQQVLNMLENMKAKGAAALDEELKTFNTYAEWADDQSKNLALEIKDGARAIAAFEATIVKADSDAAAYGRDVAAYQAEIDKHSAQLKDATETRNKENAEYLTLSQDYRESVDALDRAVQVMSSQNYDRDQAASLLQRVVNSKRGSPEALALLQRIDESQDGAPAVAAYEFQSSKIVDLLESLHEKFRKELADVEEAESNQAHQYALLKLHLTNTMEKETADRDKKSVMKGEKVALSARTQGELGETRKEKAADEALKQEIETTLQAKTDVFHENQRVRKDELAAIAKAVEIISSPEVSASYGKHVNAEFPQISTKGRVTSLLQVGRKNQESAMIRQARAILKERASALHSTNLAAVADRAAADPFAKVIGMIESMLEKLKTEAAEEADHKQWCDAQLKKNKLKRKTRTNNVNRLTADIESLAADISDMGNDIARLSMEQADLATAMAEATTLRQSEHAENTATIADAKAAMEAVSRATAILKEFYEGQTALVQTRQVPEMAAYKGMQTNKGGVIGMLEVILTDFSRLKTETEVAEKTAANEYDAFMKKSEETKVSKHESEVQLRLTKDQTEFEQSNTKKDLKGNQDELDKANDYYNYLKPNCVQIHVSYEERAARRQEEIEALKQAYTVLDQKSSD